MEDPFELLVKYLFDVLFLGVEDFDHRPWMADQIDQEGLSGFGGKPCGLEEQMNVEEISEVLAVKGGADFARIQIMGREDSHA